MLHAFRYNLPRYATRLSELGLFLDITVIKRQNVILIEVGTLPLWLAASILDWEKIKQDVTKIAEVEFTKMEELNKQKTALDATVCGTGVPLNS